MHGRLDFRRSLGSGVFGGVSAGSFPEAAAGNRAYMHGRCCFVWYTNMAAVMLCENQSNQRLAKHHYDYIIRGSYRGIFVMRD